MGMPDILAMARLYLRDNVYPYRWDDETCIRYLNDGIKELRRIRPDTRINEDGEEIEYAEIPMVQPWIYTAIDIQQIITGYQGLEGWNKHTFSTIYMICDSSTVISAYASEAELALGINKLFTINNCDSTGLKTIQPQNYHGTITGFGGTLTIVHVAIPTARITVSVTAPDLIIPEDIFDDALASFIASECLKMEWDDAQNTNKAKQFAQDFYQGVM